MNQTKLRNSYISTLWFIITCLALQSYLFGFAVTNIAPAKFSDNIELQSTFIVYFEDTFDLDSGSLSLYNNDEQRVDAHFEYDDPQLYVSGNSLQVNLHQPFDPNTQYSILLSNDLIIAHTEETFLGVTDINELTFHTNTFATGADSAASPVYLGEPLYRSTSVKDFSASTQTIFTFRLDFVGSSDTLNEIRFNPSKPISDTIEFAELWLVGDQETLLASGDNLTDGAISNYEIKFLNVNHNLAYGNQTFELRARFNPNTTTDHFYLSLYNQSYYLTFASGTDPEGPHLSQAISLLDTVPDLSELNLLETSPFEGETNVGVDRDLKLYFDRPIKNKNSGDIVITEVVTGNVHQTISNGYPDSQQKNMFVVNTNDFKENTEYQVQFDSGLLSSFDGSPLNQTVPNLSFTTGAFEQNILDQEEDIVLAQTGETQQLSPYAGSGNTFLFFRLENKSQTTQVIDTLAFRANSNDVALWSIVESVELLNIDDPNNPIVVGSKNDIFASESNDKINIKGLNITLNPGHNNFVWRAVFKNPSRATEFYFYMNASDLTMLSGDHLGNSSQPYRHVTIIPDFYNNNSSVDPYYFYPRNGETNININSSYHLDFDDDFVIGSSNIELREWISDNLISSFGSTTGNYNISNNRLNLYGTTLEPFTRYYFTSSANAVYNISSGDMSPAIDKGDWTFTTRPTTSTSEPYIRLSGQQIKYYEANTLPDDLTVLQFYIYNYENGSELIDQLKFNLIEGDLSKIQSFTLISNGTNQSSHQELKTVLKGSSHISGNTIFFESLDFSLTTQNNNFFSLIIAFETNPVAGEHYGFEIESSGVGFLDESTVQFQALQSLSYIFDTTHPLGPIAFNSTNFGDLSAVSPERNSLFYYFDEDITLGSGNLVFTNTSTGDSRTIFSASSQLYTQNSYFYLNDLQLEPETSYSVSIDPGFIITESGRPFEGIDPSAPFSFTTKLFSDLAENNPELVYMYPSSDQVQRVSTRQNQAQPALSFYLSHAGQGDTLNALTFETNYPSADVLISAELWITGSQPTLLASGDVANGVLVSNNITFENLNHAIPNGNHNFECRVWVKPEYVNTPITFSLTQYNVLFLTSNSAQGAYRIREELTFTDQTIVADELGVLTYDPSPASSNTPSDATISLKFDRDIQWIGGNIMLWNHDTNVVLDQIDAEAVHLYQNQLDFELTGDAIADTQLKIDFSQFLQGVDGTTFGASQPDYNLSTSLYNTNVTQASSSIVLDKFDGFSNQLAIANSTANVLNFSIVNKDPQLSENLVSVSIETDEIAASFYHSAELWDLDQNILLDTASKNDGSIDEYNIEFSFNIPLNFGYQNFEVRILVNDVVSQVSGYFYIDSYYLETQNGSLLSGQSTNQNIHFVPEELGPYGSIAINSLYPQNYSENLSEYQNFHVYFDEEVLPTGMGNISVYETLSGNLVNVFGEGGQELHVQNTYFYTSSPSVGYESDKSYTVIVDDNIVVSKENGRPSAGIPWGYWNVHGGSFSNETNPTASLVEASENDIVIIQGEQNDFFSFNLDITEDTSIGKIALSLSNFDVSMFNYISLYLSNGNILLATSYLSQDSTEIMFDQLNINLTAGTHTFHLSTQFKSGILTKNFSLQLDPNQILTSGGIPNGTSINKTFTIDGVIDFLDTNTFTAGPHSFIWNQNGYLYGHGYSTHGQFNTVSSELQNQIDLGREDNWAMLTSGETHVLALDVSGVLWGWGSNLDRQLLDSDETSFRSPRIIYNTEPIIWIGAGAYNSYALTESGQLICWGKNQLGQCGQSGLQNQAAQILSLPGAITDIAIGIDFGIVIIDAKLYAWGSNGFGQCGLEGSTLGRLEFTLIDESRPWTRCYAGGFHAMAFDDAGDLYVWGKNTRGQLGLGHTNPVLSPTLNNTSFDTQDIQMGYDFTLFLDVIGNLYSCGSNKYGQLGDGSYTEHTSPQFIANDISEIEAGPHSGWLSQYGSTFRWGKTPSGQFTNPTGLFSSQVLGNLTPREGTR